MQTTQEYEDLITGLAKIREQYRERLDSRISSVAATWDWVQRRGVTAQSVGAWIDAERDVKRMQECLDIINAKIGDLVYNRPQGTP